jgi:hypothetical protein
MVDGLLLAGRKAGAGLGASPEGGLLEHRADPEGDHQGRRDQGRG